MLRDLPKSEPVPEEPIYVLTSCHPLLSYSVNGVLTSFVVDSITGGGRAAMEQSQCLEQVSGTQNGTPERKAHSSEYVGADVCRRSFSLSSNGSMHVYLISYFGMGLFRSQQVFTWNV